MERENETQRKEDTKKLFLPLSLCLFVFIQYPTTHNTDNQTQRHRAHRVFLWTEGRMKHKGRKTQRNSFFLCAFLSLCSSNIHPHSLSPSVSKQKLSDLCVSVFQPTITCPDLRNNPKKKDFIVLLGDFPIFICNFTGDCRPIAPATEKKLWVHISTEATVSSGTS